MAGFNIFDFNSIPGTSVQKIGTGASMPSYQPPVQSQPVQTQQAPQQPAQSNTMRFFKDEEEANQKMLQSGLSQEQANELHKKRRNDLLGKISQKDGEALIKMRDAGLRADEAAKLVKQKRDETPDTRPLWKKAGEGTLNFLAGNLDTVLKYGGNILDVGTFGQTGIGEEVKGMTEQNKQLFGDSTAFKVGTYAPDVALGVSPIGGGYLAGAKGLANLAGRSAIVGGAFGASTPLLEKGSDATVKDVAIGAGIGATAGAVLPVVGAGLVKGARAIKPYITKTLPQNLQVSGQFNRADLTNVSERLSKLTGKDIEVDDASRWLLDREIKGDLATQRKQVQGVVQKSMDDADNLLASKTGDIGSTKEAQSLRGALKEKLDNYGSYTKEGNFKPSAGNEAQVSKMMALIDNPSMTLKEMNNGRRILADGLFNKQGTMKELASKEGWQNVWKDTSAFIEKKAPGFRTLNKNTEVGIAIDKAMIKKETAEQTKAMLSYLGLGGGTGGAIGYGTSGGDIGSTIKGIGIGFGVGQLSRILNTPAVKSNLAYYLNKLSASSRKSIQDLQKGIEIKPENIGKIVEEMKLLGPGKKTSAQVSNVKPIISPEAGALEKTSTAMAGKVGERPGTSKAPIIEPNKQKLLAPPKAQPKGTGPIRTTKDQALIAESNKGLPSQNKPLITPPKPTQAPTVPKTIETPPTAKKTGVIEPKFTREQATKYMDENIDRIMKEVKKGKLTNEEGKTQMLELKNDMKYLRMGITPERLAEGKKTILNGVMKELETPAPQKIIGLTEKGGVKNILPGNQVKYNQGVGYEPVRLVLSDTDAQIARYGALDTKNMKQFAGGPALSSAEKAEIKSIESKLGIARKDIIERAQEIKDIAQNARSKTESVLVDLRESKIPEGYFKNAFGEIVKNQNSKKAGTLNIGQIGKDLGLVKKDPTPVTKLNTGEDITLVRGTGGKGNGAGEAIRGKGLYLTDNVDVAKYYGPDIKTVTIKNSDILDGNVKLKDSKSIISSLPKEMKSYLDPSFDYTYNSLIKTIEGNTGLEAEAIAEAINGSLKGKYKGVRFEIGIVNDTLSEKGLGNKNAFILFDNKPSIIPKKIGIISPNKETGNIAYHGSANKFDEFDIGTFGSGEGSSGFGKGVYFTKSKSEAEMYKNRTSGGKGGFLYEREIPNDKYLLDFSKDYNKQSDYIKDSLIKIKGKYGEKIIDEGYNDLEELNGNNIFEALKDIYGENKASQILGNYGIKGNKYKYQSNGPDNYLIFDTKDIIHKPSILKPKAIGNK